MNITSEVFYLIKAGYWYTSNASSHPSKYGLESELVLLTLK